MIFKVIFMKYIIDLPDDDKLILKQDGWIVRHNGWVAISLPESELQEYEDNNEDNNEDIVEFR